MGGSQVATSMARSNCGPRLGGGEPVVLSHGSTIYSLAVLPDERLASGGRDGKIKLWLVDEQKLIAALCLRAGRNLTKDEWVHYIGADTPWQPSCRTLPSNWRTPDATQPILGAIAHNNFGNTKDREASFDEAAAEYRAAIALDPKSALPHNGLGNVLRD